MRDNSVKLQRLIEELLDFQRALQRRRRSRCAWWSSTTGQRSGTRHELAAQAKGLRLTIEAQSATLEADPQKLRSIVRQLISNAVKFTPPAAPSLCAPARWRARR